MYLWSERIKTSEVIIWNQRSDDLREKEFNFSKRFSSNSVHSVYVLKMCFDFKIFLHFQQIFNCPQPEAQDPVRTLPGGPQDNVKIIGVKKVT